MDQYLAIGSEQGNLPEFRVGIVCDGLLERVCGVAATFQQFEQLFADGGVTALGTNIVNMAVIGVAAAAGGALTGLLYSQSVGALIAVVIAIQVASLSVLPAVRRAADSPGRV